MVGPPSTFARDAGGKAASMAHPRDPLTTPVSSSEQTGCLAALVRLAWLIGGGAALAILTLFIARTGRLSGLDLVFWVVVILMAVVRFVDITRFGGLTSDGEPATARTWRRYVLRLVLIAGGLWALAHTVLPHIAP
jgi:hypothetical protein